MSERIRFDAAQQVIDTFPAAFDEDLASLPDESPEAFARRLAGGPLGFNALALIACGLPRREAVWWGCQCLRTVELKGPDERLLAAEDWVRAPDEATRRTALRLGAAGRVREPSTWIALAAGHSGGSVTAEGATPLAASPLATPMNVKIAIVLAVVRRPLLRQAEWTRACVEAGIRFAGGGEASVAAPGEPAAPAPRRPETPARPVRASR